MSTQRRWRFVDKSRPDLTETPNCTASKSLVDEAIWPPAQSLLLWQTSFGVGIIWGSRSLADLKKEKDSRDSCALDWATRPATPTMSLDGLQSAFPFRALGWTLSARSQCVLSKIAHLQASPSTTDPDCNCPALAANSTRFYLTTGTAPQASRLSLVTLAISRNGVQLA